jgi:hypothetical protein
VFENKFIYKNEWGFLVASSYMDNTKSLSYYGGIFSSINCQILLKLMLGNIKTEVNKFLIYEFICVVIFYVQNITPTLRCLKHDNIRFKIMWFSLLN